MWYLQSKVKKYEIKHIKYYFKYMIESNDFKKALAIYFKVFTKVDLENWENINTGLHRLFGSITLYQHLQQILK